MEERMVELLNGPYRELRDDNHISPEILVFDEAADVIYEVAPEKLRGQFPTKGPGCRWSEGDLNKILADKKEALRWSLIAHKLHDQDPTVEVPCRTVILAIPKDNRLFRRYQTLARLEPEIPR